MTLTKRTSWIIMIHAAPSEKCPFLISHSTASRMQWMKSSTAAHKKRNVHISGTRESQNRAGKTSSEEWTFKEILGTPPWANAFKWQIKTSCLLKAKKTPDGYESETWRETQREASEAPLAPDCQLIIFSPPNHALKYLWISGCRCGHLNN